MALNYIEQQSLLDGTEGPEAFTLDQLMNLAAMNFALAWRRNYTIVDAAVLPEAAQYVARMLRLCNKLTEQGSRQPAVASLVQVMVSTIATSSVTMAQVQGASDNQWGGFVDSNMLASFEAVAGVRQEEKTQYDAIP